MRMNDQRLADFVVVVLLAIFIGWYTWDAYQASSEVENLILIFPIATIAVVLCALELIQQKKRSQQNSKQENQLKQAPVHDVLPVIVLFTVYVLSLETLGFDVATTVFVALFLWLQKERRIIWLLGYSLIFGIVMSIFFAKMLPYPMPMSILPTDY